MRVPDLTSLQRSTIRAREQVWRGATVRDLLTELLVTQEAVEGCAHHIKAGFFSDAEE